MVRVQRRIDHLVHGFVEAFVLESHSLGESPKDFYIRPTLTQRLDGLIGYLQKVVPVSGLQVLVLEKRGRRQNDVSIVGRVGKELFVDDGKQIGTQQPANDFVVIGTRRRRITAVNEQRLDRRIV